MNPQQHITAREIFLKSFEYDSDQIEEYILSSTNDEQVIKLVYELIDTYQSNTLNTNDFEYAIADNISKSLTLFPTDRYTLIKKIGQGGMGDVFLAQRKIKDIKQQVAIKVLSRTDDFSKERFSRETSILSQLTHPNISQFIDADFMQDETPYVVMEYTPGIAITEYCKQNKIDIKSVLSLFLKLCDSIQYAHRNLIIHRDIKPNNILVTEKGELKLIDFGIAKILQETEQKTLTHMRAMTPAYASPEQFLGKPITVSSDVYSLGIILYELLAGVRPFDFKTNTPVEIEKVLTETPPILPSKKITESSKAHLAKEITGDLDQIVLKALRFDVNQRYQTVSELKDDIHRYLNDLPVLAQAPSVGYKFKKFIKRNKLIVASVFALSVFIVSSIFVLVNQRNIALREQQKAEILSETFIQAFKNAEPTKTNGKEVKALDIMEQSVKLLEAKTIKNPILKSQLSIPIAQVYNNLGEPKKAVDILSEIESNYQYLSPQKKVKFMSEKALAQLHFFASEELVIPIINNAIKELGPDPLLIYTYGTILRFLSRYHEAVKILEEPFNNLSVDHELYIPMCSIYGYAVFSTDKFSQAKEIFSHCLAILNGKKGGILQWEKSVIYLRFGRLYLESKQPKKALELFKKSQKIRTELLGADHTSTTDLSIYIGDSLTQSGNPEKAFTHIEIGLNGRIRFSKNNLGKSSVAKPLFSKANAYFAMKKYNEAEELFQKCIDLMEIDGFFDLFNNGWNYQRLGETKLMLNKPVQAKSAFNNAIKIFQAPKYRESNVNTLEAKALLAQAHYQIKEFIKARDILEKIIPDLEASHLSNAPVTLHAKELLLVLNNQINH